MKKIYAILLLPILFTTHVYGITLVNITTEDTAGLSLGRGDIVIVSKDAIPMMDSFKGKRLESHVRKVYVCHDESCINNVVDHYKKKYVTQGLCYIDWK